MNQSVYLDNNATTPLDPRVFEVMTPYFQERFGNAASRHHTLGCEAAQAVENARAQVAGLIGADPREIIFTSGATESVNLAIKGIAASPHYSSRQRHIVTVSTEHKAVIDTCGFLESNGYELTFLRVDGMGRLDLDDLASAIHEQTLLVSVMYANNETGVLHPIKEIARLCKERGVLFHTDATQAVGKLAIDVEQWGIDLLSCSSHKLYGPKGIGALYLRRRKPRVRCEPLIHGGGHERGFRSGTLNVPAIVGFGEAAQLAAHEMHHDADRIGKLRDAFEETLMSRLCGVERNGDGKQRLYNTTNLSFADVSGDALMQSLFDVAVSSSSACTSALMQPSYVLGAMGLSDARMVGSIRFSLGRFTTREEIDYAAQRVVAEVQKLRAKYPVS